MLFAADVGFFFLCFLAFWLGICVEVYGDIITPPLCFCPYPHNSLFNTSDSYQFEIQISARLKLVSLPFSSLLLDIGHLEKKIPGEHHVSSEMGQSYYDIILSFHLTKRIHYPDPG